MTLRTANDLISSLRGAAFRRATWDGRTWFLRAIKTVGTLHHRQHLTCTPRQRHRSALQVVAVPAEAGVRR